MPQRISTLLFIGLASAACLFGQKQYYSTLLNTPPNCIELQGESLITWGSIENGVITLEQLALDENGYIDFYFENLAPTDDIVLRFQEANNSSTYYQFHFSNNEIKIEDDQNTSITLPTSIQRTPNIFRLERCGGKIIWYANGSQLLFSTGSANVPLVAVLEPVLADNVQLHLTFEPNLAFCEKCSDTGGTKLHPGDLMFTGFDNQNDGLSDEQDFIQIRNQIDLETGTTFVLSEAVYESSTEYWYAGDGRTDATIASQQITYTGTATIPANSIICFRLENTGSREALLAKDFYVNNIFSDNDFCVKNVGNITDPKINLSTSNPDALFLMQGVWKFETTHGVFCGRVLSGLQYGGNWLADGSNLPPNTRLSQIPPDIECLYLEDSDAPSSTYAQYLENHNNGNYTTILDYLIDFDVNWTENDNGEDLDCSPLMPLVANNEMKKEVLIYPNPFENTFTVEMTLGQKQHLQLLLTDARGNVVTNLFNGFVEAGWQQWHWEYQGLSSGLYILQIIGKEGIVGYKIVKGGGEVVPLKPVFISPGGP